MAGQMFLCPVGATAEERLMWYVQMQVSGLQMEINGMHLNMKEHPVQVKLALPTAVVPKRASCGAAGYDLCCAIPDVVKARGRQLIHTGVRVAIPPGRYGRIAPRSGLALKNGIDVGGGVIDSDYRGQVDVILFNHSDVDFKVAQGDRIAQLIIERCSEETMEVVTAFDAEDTVRGSGGFGSTGVASATTAVASTAAATATTAVAANTATAPAAAAAAK